MRLDETRNRTHAGVWVRLRQLMDEHPDARIATEPPEGVDDEKVELLQVIWHEREHEIELIFDWSRR